MTVDNSARVGHGVRRITVDGKALDGKIIPIAQAGTTVKVAVEMG